MLPSLGSKFAHTLLAGVPQFGLTAFTLLRERNRNRPFKGRFNLFRRLRRPISQFYVQQHFAIALPRTCVSWTTLGNAAKGTGRLEEALPGSYLRAPPVVPADYILRAPYDKPAIDDRRLEAISAQPQLLRHSLKGPGSITPVIDLSR